MFDTSYNLVTYIIWKPYTCRTFYIPILMSSDTLKFFRALWRWKNHEKSTFFKFLGLKISFVISIKSQKVACGHVCVHKNIWSFVWSRRLLLRVPMDVNMYLTSYFGVFSALEIFFGTQSTRQWYAKLQFFVILHLDFCSENDFESIISKNRRVVTFSQLKIVWSIVWCSRLLLRVATDLNKCVTT